ncbi:MAG TPA: ferritin family protein [bacterium]|nr:ferritin family protein [bacterium]
MGNFKASEFLQVAIRIEENGEKLYRHARTLTDDAKIKDLFGFLADEETKHKRTFEEMVSKLETYEPAETYPGEYFAYLRAYADSLIFSPDEVDEELEDIFDVDEAVEFAMEREIESILYYLEAKSLVPASQAEAIDRIVAEERRHYLKLVELKRSLD